MSEPICECCCHGYHEVRKDLCEHCAFFCESHERYFTENPHATEDGYWLCDPCYESLKEEVKP